MAAGKYLLQNFAVIYTTLLSHHDWPQPAIHNSVPVISPHRTIHDRPLFSAVTKELAYTSLDIKVCENEYDNLLCIAFAK